MAGCYCSIFQGESLESEAWRQEVTTHSEAAPEQQGQDSDRPVCCCHTHSGEERGSGHVQLGASEDRQLTGQADEEGAVSLGWVGQMKF